MRKTNYVSYLDTVVPKKTNSYMPVRHETLRNMIEELITERGYGVVSHSVSQNKLGTQIVGNFTIERNSSNEEFCQSLSYMNSYDKTKAIQLVSGAQVFVCLNGMIVGEILSYRKHTSNVFADLYRLINQAVDGFDAYYKKTVYDVSLMKAIELTRQEESELAGRLLIDEGIINTTEINTIIRQLSKPKFEAFKAHNMWSFYNHATYSLKKAHPSRKMDALKGLHEFCTAYSADVATLNNIQVCV